jgi:hypothetical protein
MDTNTLRNSSKKEKEMYVMDEKARTANRERQRKYREAHRDEINDKRRERYNDRIEAGKCPRCGGKVKKGYTLCEGCCDYQADLNKKYARQRKKSAPKAKTTVKAKTGAKTKTKKK